LTGASRRARDAHIAEIMQLLERAEHPRGEPLVERDRMRRFAERDGRYDELYGMINPS
jgi:uncharacterized oxidoreductase